jgi:hypothetical protein
LLLLVLVPEELLGVEMAGLGLIGAAIAALVSTIVIVIMTRFTVREMSDTRLNSHLIVHGLCGLGAGMAAYLFSTVWPLEGFVGLLFYFTLVFGVFYALMYILKEVTYKDVQYFCDILDLRKMSSYIRKELRE